VSGAAAPKAVSGLWWGLVLLALAAYVFLHRGPLLVRPAGEPELPWPDVALPPGLGPLAVAAAALAGGFLLARRHVVAGAPLAVRWAVAAYACLAVPAHLLEIAGRVLHQPLFRPWPWTLAILIVSGAALALRTKSPATDGVPDSDRLPSWLVVLALLVAALHAHSVGRTVVAGARAWDGEAYHLPVALQWNHLGSLIEPLARQVPFGIWGLEKFANPGNGHLLMSVPLAAGWDRLACLVQLPWVLVAAWAVATLASAAGASRAGAMLAALAFASAPIVAEQAAVPMLDLLTAALSLTGLALVVSTADEAQPPRAALAWAGLCLGLALGTKTTALSHLGIVVAAALVSRWLWRARPRALLGASAAPLMLLLAPSVFWYGRSAALFGNPVHPIELRILGWTIAEGTTAEDMSGRWDLDRMKMASRREWLLFPLRDPEYGDETGFGALLVSLGAAGVLVGVGDLALLRRGLTPYRRLALLTVVAFAAFWFAAARTPRFNLPLLGLVAALGGTTADRLVSRRSLVGIAAIAAAALTLKISLGVHGWDMGRSRTRAQLLEGDWPGIPAGIDTLPPLTLFNDTAVDYTSQPSNYKLFGADHRHLVYDHPTLAEDADAAAYVARLRRLGVDAVYLRCKVSEPTPPRYASPAFEPLLRYDGREFRSIVYRVR
jgi:hypothetical protein